jgi:ferredoxin
MSLIHRLLGLDPASPADTLAVDRTACTGHGICARILAESITLDDWGYPILHEATPDPALAAEAIALCPAAALRWIRTPRGPVTN